ncbi:MAG: hypothetical protein PHP54_04275 [Clostridia bacterium]|nr:hypothetical protein [Clostridia bacterium]
MGNVKLDEKYCFLTNNLPKTIYNRTVFNKCFRENLAIQDNGNYQSIVGNNMYCLEKAIAPNVFSNVAIPFETIVFINMEHCNIVLWSRGKKTPATTQSLKRVMANIIFMLDDCYGFEV